MDCLERALTITKADRNFLSSDEFKDWIFSQGVKQADHWYDQILPIAQAAGYKMIFKDSYMKSRIAHVRREFGLDSHRPMEIFALSDYDGFVIPPMYDMNEVEGILKFNTLTCEYESIFPHIVFICRRFQNIATGEMSMCIVSYDNGETRVLSIDALTISGSQNILLLSRLGIRVNSNNSQMLVAFLGDFLSANIEKLTPEKSTSKLGWHDDKFLPYDNGVAFDGEQDYKNIYESISENGDYDAWLKYVRDMCHYNGLTRLILASSLVAPLLKITGGLPFILHLWGTSGSGKTVAQMMAASIWGNPNIGSYLRSLKNTSVSFELTANMLNNLPMICDELHLLKNNYLYKDGFDDLIMMLCAGIGKGRGKAAGGVQTLTNWCTNFIFSGEFPITTNNMGGGSKNRVIEIEAIGDLVKNGKKDSNFLRENYGHMGSRYIEILKIISPKKLNEKHGEYFEKLKTRAEDKQALSMAYILLADYIASKYFFKWDPLTADDVIEYVHNKTETLTFERSYRSVISLIQANPVRFKGIDENKGERWGRIEESGICLFQRAILEREMTKENFNLRANLREWHKSGYIIDNGHGKFSLQRRLDGILTSYIGIIMPNGNGDIIQDNSFIDDIPEEFKLPV